MFNTFQNRDSAYSVVNKKYWCHICRKQNSLRLENEQINQEQYCSQCSTILEEIQPNQQHPKDFSVYQQPIRIRPQQLIFHIFYFTESEPQNNTGANDEQINSLHKEHHTGNQEQTCYICQEDFKQGEIVAKMNCNHGYHEQCIKKWLKMNNSCPVCRCKQN